MILEFIFSFLHPYKSLLTTSSINRIHFYTEIYTYNNNILKLEQFFKIPPPTEPMKS